MFLLHKTIKLTTDYHGKEEAIGSIPVGSFPQIACPVMDWAIFILQGNSLVFYYKVKITLVNFHHISLPKRNVIFLHQRHILYNLYLQLLFILFLVIFSVIIIL